MTVDSTAPIFEKGGSPSFSEEISKCLRTDRIPARWWAPSVIEAPRAEADGYSFGTSPSARTAVTRAETRLGLNHQLAIPARIARFVSTPDEVDSRIKWQGYVTEILSDGFAARFQSDEIDREAIIAEFDFDELEPEDRSILKTGSLLVWATFMERDKGGMTNSSKLYVRRQLPVTRKEIQAASEKLDEWFGHIDDEPSAS